MPNHITTSPAKATVNAPSPAARTEVRQNLPAQGQSVPPDNAATQAAQLSQAVSTINDYVQNLRRDLEFTIDEATERTVIKVIDAETQEVIRQIPSEEVLALARSLEKAQGVILRAQA